MFTALSISTAGFLQNGEYCCQRSPRCGEDGRQKRGKLASVTHATCTAKCHVLVRTTVSTQSLATVSDLQSSFAIVLRVFLPPVQGRVSTPRVVAVSKGHPVDKVLEAYEQGLRDFGENYVQELLSKSSLLAKSGAAADIRWHYVGNLQRRKAKRLISQCDLPE